MKRIAAFALSLVLSLSLAVPAFAQDSSPFSDVPQDYWAGPSIRRAYGDGVIKGIGNDPETGLPIFAPAGALASAQFAAIVTQGFYSQRLDMSLTDPWYAPYQKAAEEAGLFAGTGIQNMGDPMSRYQMAQMLYNILVDKGAGLPGEAELKSAQAKIADWDQVPQAYQRAVSSAYALGLLSGVDTAGTFAGDATLSRAQAAIVYCKLADLVQGSGSQENTASPDKAAVALFELILKGNAATAVSTFGFASEEEARQAAGVDGSLYDELGNELVSQFAAMGLNVSKKDADTLVNGILVLFQKVEMTAQVKQLNESTGTAVVTCTVSTISPSALEDAMTKALEEMLTDPSLMFASEDVLVSTMINKVAEVISELSPTGQNASFDAEFERFDVDGREIWLPKDAEAFGSDIATSVLGV